MSNEIKRYYWLKLKDNFFDEDDIRLLKSRPNGEKYIVFLLQLRLKSINTEGKLLYKNMFPYDENMLSTITNTDIDVVRTAMQIFKNLGLVSILDDGTIYMNQVNELIGSESKWAKVKRNQRLKSKEDNVQSLSNKRPKNVLQEKETDKDIDLEKDIEKEKNQHHPESQNHNVVDGNNSNKNDLNNAIEIIKSSFIASVKKHPTATDLASMREILVIPLGVPLTYEARTKIIVDVITQVSHDFKAKYPKETINSFNYFSKPITKEFNLYTKNNSKIDNAKIGSPSKNEIETFFEEAWSMYPKKIGKNKITYSQKESLFKLGTYFLSCIERYLKFDNELILNGGWKEIQNGSTFFNSGYLEWTEESFKNRLNNPVKSMTEADKLLSHYHKYKEEGLL
jgi:predicted phage replisome organizer